MKKIFLIICLYILLILTACQNEINTSKASLGTNIVTGSPVISSTLKAEGEPISVSVEIEESSEKEDNIQEDKENAKAPTTSNEAQEVIEEDGGEPIMDTNESDYSLPIYFDYQGGDLPPDVITSIDYTLESSVNDNMPSFVFKLKGLCVQSYGTTSDKTKYYLKDGENHIDSIKISCSDFSYSQELTFSETSTPDIADHPYGFSLDDWNFDGYLDIGLWKYEGGTSLNVPTYYWLWNVDENKYIINEELESISDIHFLELDEQYQQVIANERLTNGMYTGYYCWQNGELILVQTEELLFVGKNELGQSMVRHTITELIDREMVITSQYDEIVN